MPNTILQIDSSMRHEGSRSRALTAALVQSLAQKDSHTQIISRDLSKGVEFINADWITANFTPPGERTAEQRSVLAYSDTLLNELKSADMLVIGTPIYNFGIPAALKAWIDMIVRAQEAFRYTTNGPLGLLQGKSAYITIVSGGTKAGSDIDFALPYLKHILGFIGVSDITVIDSDLANTDKERADKTALSNIQALA